MFEPRQGLRVVDSVAVPDSGWRRPWRGPEHLPSVYALEHPRYRVLLSTEPLRTAQPSLFVVSAFGPSGDSLTVRGAGIGKAVRGTGIAFYIHVSEQPDEIQFEVVAPTGEVVDRVRLPYALRSHSRFCGIEYI